VNSKASDEYVQAMTARYASVAAAIEVDADGRVTARTADGVQAIKTASVYKTPTGGNTNCKECNTAKGCGPLNYAKHCAALRRA
jgi:hypothetical protein